MAILTVWLVSLIAKVEVLNVHDGDTLRFRTQDGFQIKGRLLGIDCPEVANKHKKTKSQPGGEAAKEKLKELSPHIASVIPYEADAYNRTLVELKLQNGRLANEVLVEEGFCEAYQGKISHNETFYRAAETRAKRAKKGIWAMTNYESPRLFRKREMR